MFALEKANFAFERRSCSSSSISLTYLNLKVGVSDACGFADPKLEIYQLNIRWTLPWFLLEWTHVIPHGLIRVVWAIPKQPRRHPLSRNVPSAQAWKSLRYPLVHRQCTELRLPPISLRLPPHATRNISVIDRLTRGEILLGFAQWRRNQCREQAHRVTSDRGLLVWLQQRFFDFDVRRPSSALSQASVTNNYCRPGGLNSIA